jgi:hypothetical protein
MQCVQSSENTTYGNPRTRIVGNNSLSMKLVNFLIYLAQWIACIMSALILEAVADQNLHIWHIYFGLPGSNNDLNVLDRSPMIHDLLSGAACDMTFEVNGQLYNYYYLLADGIYPQWILSTMVFTHNGFFRCLH